MKTNKKYLIGTGVAAAVLAVGGTVAFFTSTDSITNPFATGSTTDNDDNAGIDVVEDFRTLALSDDQMRATDEEYTLLGVTYKNVNPIRGFEEYDNDDDAVTDKADNYGEKPGVNGEGPTEMLPGELFIKQMRVNSTVNYNQYLRIMPEIVFDGEPVTFDIAAIKVTSGTPYVEISLPDQPGSLIIELDPSVLTEWTLGSDGYFYYDSVFAPEAFTPDIVRSVVITADAENAWQNKTLDITLNADSIQATDDAWASWAPVDVPQP